MFGELRPGNEISACKLGRQPRNPQRNRLQRSGVSVTLLEDLMDPSVGKREEAGLVEKLTNLCVVLASGHVVCRDIPSALSSSHISLLMDAVQKELCAFLLSEA